MEKRRPRPILKRSFGPHRSEGQRQLWIVLIDRDWTQGQLGDRVGADSGLVNRWLHAEGRPGRRFLGPIQEQLGIPLPAWEQPYAGSFPLPELEQLAAEAA